MDLLRRTALAFSLVLLGTGIGSAASLETDGGTAALSPAARQAQAADLRVDVYRPARKRIYRSSHVRHVIWVPNSVHYPRPRNRMGAYVAVSSVKVYKRTRHVPVEPGYLPLK
jgi:hypothetical protein